MNTQGIERCEIMGDWYEDVRRQKEEEQVEAHYQDWLGRQPKEISKVCTQRGMHNWVLAIHWRNNRGEHFSEYFETEKAWNDRHEELQGMRFYAYHPPI